MTVDSVSCFSFDYLRRACPKVFISLYHPIATFYKKRIMLYDINDTFYLVPVFDFHDF